MTFREFIFVVIGLLFIAFEPTLMADKGGKGRSGSRSSGRSYSRGRYYRGYRRPVYWGGYYGPVAPYGPIAAINYPYWNGYYGPYDYYGPRPGFSFGFTI